MGNKLLEKLKVKPEHSVLVMNGFDDVTEILGEFPTKKANTYDVVFLFVKNSKDLNTQISKALKKLLTGGLFWIIYPKTKTAIPTDLNTMAPWKILEDHGVNIVSSAAINETWTAVRVRAIVYTKPSGLCLDDIPDSPYAKYIDIEARTVTMPDDLAAALKNHPEGKHYFEQLSFTNKKEYVLWILTAKQEKTRISRVEKAVEKLIGKKKNPSEK